MSSYFNTVQDGKEYLAYLFDIPLKSIKKENKHLVVKIYEHLTGNEDPKSLDQHGFKLKKKDKTEVHFVMTPFRGGYDIWIVGDNNISVRL